MHKRITRLHNLFPRFYFTFYYKIVYLIQHTQYAVLWNSSWELRTSVRVTLQFNFLFCTSYWVDDAAPDIVDAGVKQKKFKQQLVEAAVPFGPVPLLSSKMSSWSVRVCLMDSTKLQAWYEERERDWKSKEGKERNTSLSTRSKVPGKKYPVDKYPVKDTCSGKRPRLDAKEGCAKGSVFNFNTHDWITLSRISRSYLDGFQPVPIAQHASLSVHDSASSPDAVKETRKEHQEQPFATNMIPK